MLEHQTDYQTTSIQCIQSIQSIQCIQCSPPFLDYTAAQEYILIQQKVHKVSNRRVHDNDRPVFAHPLKFLSTAEVKSQPSKVCKSHCYGDWNLSSTLKNPMASWNPNASSDPKSHSKVLNDSNCGKCKRYGMAAEIFCQSINAYGLHKWSWMCTLTSVSIPHIPPE